MYQNRALRRWLVFVAILRLLSVYIGVFHPEKFRTNLFDLEPLEVTNLYGRTFATWTFLTCALCILTSKNPENRAIYLATLLSFLAAFLHFSTELLIFKTISLRNSTIPLSIAAISSLWMMAGWNYYTRSGNEEINNSY